MNKLNINDQNIEVNDYKIISNKIDTNEDISYEKRRSFSDKTFNMTLEELHKLDNEHASRIFPVEVEEYTVNGKHKVYKKK